MGIPIFLSADNNYAPFVATTIASICDNTKSFCDFYILDGGITKENQEKIESLKTQFKNFSIEFIKIDIEKYFKDFVCGFHFSKTTYTRFLIPEIKPKLNKIMYSDVDIIALGDIAKMYEEDLNGYALGAVWEEHAEKKRNIKRKNTLNLSNAHKYFSAGNLLIDCKKWREENITEKLFDIEKENRDNLKSADQDILNKYFDNNYKVLSPKYCWTYQNYDFYKETPNIIIRHFNGPIKPWHIGEKVLENKLLSFTLNKNNFWHYAKMTHFYDEISLTVQYLTNQSLNKYLVYNILKQKSGSLKSAK